MNKIKKILLTLALYLFLGAGCCAYLNGAKAYADPTQEELLAQYYAALAKQQQAQAANTAALSQEEQLAQYYAALAKMQQAQVQSAPNDVVYKSGNIDNSARLQNAFNNLPSNVSNFLRKQSSFKIYACSYDEIASSRGSGTLGYCPATFTYSGGRTSIKAPVYIGDRETANQSMEWVLYHELGHAVDNYNGSVKNYNVVRMSDLYPGIMDVQNYTSSNTYNQIECFAQAFAAYLLDNAGLAAKAPNAYASMMNVIASLQ